MNTFQNNIVKFNKMYGMPASEIPNLDDIGNPLIRLKNFKDILQKELNEVDDIIEELQTLPFDDINVLTNLADWLGDMQVYCASEMTKLGLNNSKVLDLIMESNFSKLDENGIPIIDERGKLLKGSNYWKPEPSIKTYIKEAINIGLAPYSLSDPK